MLQKDTPKKHLNLIRRVARIDKEAAKYIKQRLKEYEPGAKDYYTSRTLVDSFVFAATPQGGNYWYKLAKQLKEY